MEPVLDDATLVLAAHELAARDADLAGVLARRGVPPMWGREPGFPTLVYIILEQQVSLASARAAYMRLLAAADPLVPERLLEFDDARLKEIGFSRQKMAYARSLARDLLSGALELDALAQMDDAQAHARLVALHGVGEWSANIYLLMALRRADIWPVGDLGLIVGAQVVKNMSARPTRGALIALGEAWRPWRSVATRLLWSEYLAHQSAGTLPRPR